MPKPIWRCRSINSCSSGVSVAGFSSSRSGTPIFPTSCSKAAISKQSRSSSGNCMASAQAEQPSATLTLCEAVAPCLQRSAANKLWAKPSRTWARWFSDSPSGVSCEPDSFCGCGSKCSSRAVNVLSCCSTAGARSLRPGETTACCEFDSLPLRRGQPPPAFGFVIFLPSPTFNLLVTRSVAGRRPIGVADQSARAL